MSAAAFPSLHIIPPSPSMSGPGSGPASLQRIDPLAEWIQKNCIHDSSGAYLYKEGAEEFKAAQITFPVTLDGRQLEATVSGSVVVITIVHLKSAVCKTPNALALWIGKNCREEQGEFVYNGRGPVQDQIVEAERSFPKSADGRKLFAQIRNDDVVITVIVPPSNGAPILPRAGSAAVTSP